MKWLGWLPATGEVLHSCFSSVITGVEFLRENGPNWFSAPVRVYSLSLIPSQLFTVDAPFVSPRPCWLVLIRRQTGYHDLSVLEAAVHSEGQQVSVAHTITLPVVSFKQRIQVYLKLEEPSDMNTGTTSANGNSVSECVWAVCVSTVMCVFVMCVQCVWCFCCFN